MRTLVGETKKSLGLNIQALSSDAVVNGNSIDLSEYNSQEASIEVVLMTGARSAGTIEIKDFQFSSVDNFASDVTTVDASTNAEHIIAGDRTSATAPIAQTVIDAADTFKKIGLHNPTTKRYFRVRFETKSSANLTAGALVSLKMLKTPVNQ